MILYCSQVLYYSPGLTNRYDRLYSLPPYTSSKQQKITGNCIGAAPHGDDDAAAAATAVLVGAAAFQLGTWSIHFTRVSSLNCALVLSVESVENGKGRWQDKRPGWSTGWMMTFTTALALVRCPWLENGHVEHLGGAISSELTRTHRRRSETLFCFCVVDDVETKALPLVSQIVPIGRKRNFSATPLYMPGIFCTDTTCSCFIANNYILFSEISTLINIKHINFTI